MRILQIIPFYLLFVACGYLVPRQATAQTADALAETQHLIARLLPDHHEQIKIKFSTDSIHEDVFEIESVGDHILLTGNNGVSIASALHYYLRTICKSDISWNGSQLNLPERLPAIPKKIRETSPYTYRYYLNYVTYNYSMAWWDWERWEKEIDWMALHGINMPLTIGGQNSVWQRVYRSLGFTDKELETFFSGPAYSGFNWMGLLDGYGGPLPQHWIDQQEVMTKKILQRQRALGMKPVLPAFTGHVPPGLREKFPEAKTQKVQWTVFPEVDILDPNDPLFVEIGRRFIAEQIKTYGTDHLYTADTFIEVMPPSNDPVYLRDMSRQLYQSMAAADPKAVWVMQGWMFYFKEDFWQPEQIKALLNAVPDDNMIVLDLWTETRPAWDRTEAYYGKPWLWCMVHNFGGNNNLFGKMPIIANGPANTLNHPDKGKLQGIGITTETIGHTPVIYQLFLDNVWRRDTIDLDQWVADYAQRRYDSTNEQALRAWHILQNTVYGYTGDINSGGSRSMANARPGFARQGPRTNVHSFYNPADLLPAWEQLLQASDELKENEGYQYDLVNVTRQVLANYADELHAHYVVAYEQKNQQKMKQYSTQFLAVIDDMDQLLGTHPDFLLGSWLEDARSWGTSPEEQNLYEWNARNLLTLWHGKIGTTLHDYSARQWNGLMGHFYKKRWKVFFNYVADQSRKGQEPDTDAINDTIRDWEWEWIHAKDNYPTRPQGDAVEIARALFSTYHDEIAGIYSSAVNPITGETLPAPAF